jgi:hypothetical protein
VQRIEPKKNTHIYRVTISDIILILFILSITIGAVIFSGQDMSRSLPNDHKVSIFHEGKIVRQIKLDKDQEFTLLNGDMSIEVRDNKLRVKKSNCPRQTCVHMGWIYYPGEKIVCLPHKIFIEIESSDSSVVDAVAY